MHIRIQDIAMLFSISMFSLVMCTSNPIFKDEDPSSQRIVEGDIRLSDNTSPGGVFVWLEELNISTVTDENGAFSLQLPPFQSQPGGGLTGDYNIYYYVGNYGLGSSSIALLNGSILHDAGDVDSDGDIKGTVILNKLLDIGTEINLPEILETDSFRLVIKVTLIPQGDPVEVETMKNPDGWITRMIFKKMDASIGEAAMYSAGGSWVTETIRQRTTWQIGIKAWWLSPRPYLTLEPGIYDIIPYLYVSRDELPNDLIKAIASYGNMFHTDYLKIPFRRDLAQLTVR